MKRFIFLTILIFYSLTTLSQHKMRPVEELINTADPGWTLVEGWIKSAKNKVEVLRADPQQAKDALYKIQVTTRSPMGRAD